jgi:trk system potassium uptake protein
MRPLTRPLPDRWTVIGGIRRSLWQQITPPQLFVGSFALLILIGTVGFQVLPGLYTGEPMTWLDSLFTSTSAVCVTGLVVVDPASRFTFAGQAWLLLLIQLGGLGMITFASLIILALGGRLSLRAESLSAGSLDPAPMVRPQQLILHILLFTLTFEGTGALLLYLTWVPRFGWDGAAWPAVFHSVSAFCNAGFSTFSDNLIGFQRSPLSLTVVMALIVGGGIGFLTLEELVLWFQTSHSQKRFRLSLHSQLVLGTTALLLVVGWLVLGALEWEGTLKSLPWYDRLVNALFLSVTPRTAGFNTIDYGQASEATNYVTILLMSVGGSPGSTAGGMKTTTFILIGLMAWARFQGRQVTSFRGRSVRAETTGMAVGLFVVCFTLVTLGILVLTMTEPGVGGHGQFLDWMFEAVSAFNTVGLSTGVTPGLSAAGRVVAIVLMFLGRVGPLTFAAALARNPAQPERFRYAYEGVVVG